MTIHKNKYAVLEKEKVCAIDVDGVLNSYPQAWVNFANDALGTDFKDLNELKDKVSYRIYKQTKHEYRLKGECQEPAVAEAARATAELKRMGFKIILLTSRPHDIYKNLFSDTVRWLQENNITYDSIVWDRSKHVRILQECPHLCFMVEDNAYFANLVAQWGYKVFLIRTPYNKGQAANGVIELNSLAEIIEAVKHLTVEEENEAKID